MEDVGAQLDIHIGFYFTNLVYSKGSIILYYDRSKECFQLKYFKDNSGNSFNGRCPIVFAFDKDKNIIAYRSISALTIGNFDLYKGCCISCSLENDKLYFSINNRYLQLSDAEYMIARRAFVENAINESPSEFFLLKKQEEKFMSICEYVDRLDINKILLSLEISISEKFICKAGGDDRYYVHRTTSSKLDVVHSDTYLTKTLRIGRDTIYSDSGYTSAYNMALPNLKTGELEGKDLSRYLEELKKSYSKDDHIYYLLKDWIRDNIMKVYENKEKMQKLLYEINYDLTRLYHLKFYKTGFYFDTFGGVTFANCKGLLFYDLDKQLHSFEKMSEKIEEFNAHIYKYSSYIAKTNNKFKSEFNSFK